MALKMKEGVHWVDLPKELQPKLPAVQGPVEYRFTETEPDYQQGGRKRTIYRNEIALPSIFTIRKGDKMITLGLVGGYDPQGNPNAGEIQSLTFKPQSLAGRLYVHPEQGEEQLSIYQALELHPMVGGNSNPDTFTAKVMEKVDSVAEAQANRKARENKRKAFTTATNLKAGDELYRAALTLGINPDRDEEVLRDEIEAQAENTPGDFLTKMTDKDKDLKADFMLAKNAGVISIDGEANVLRWAENKAEIMKLTRTDVPNAAQEYADFVNEGEKGTQIHSSLQKTTAAKRKLDQKESGK